MILLLLSRDIKRVLVLILIIAQDFLHHKSYWRKQVGKTKLFQVWLTIKTIIHQLEISDISPRNNIISQRPLWLFRCCVIVKCEYVKTGEKRKHKNVLEWGHKEIYYDHVDAVLNKDDMHRTIDVILFNVSHWFAAIKSSSMRLRHNYMQIS